MTQVVVWTDFETARKLHVRRMQSGRGLALCGYMPPLWTHSVPVVDPSDSECCKRCAVVSKRRKRDWPRG
jgi:hypothetical protein